MEAHGRNRFVLQWGSQDNLNSRLAIQVMVSCRRNANLLLRYWSPQYTLPIHQQKNGVCMSRSLHKDGGGGKSQEIGLEAKYIESTRGGRMEGIKKWSEWLSY